MFYENVNHFANQVLVFWVYVTLLMCEISSKTKNIDAAFRVGHQGIHGGSEGEGQTSGVSSTQNSS